MPSALDEDLIVGFSFIVAPLLETLSHNLEDPSAAVIQRVAYSDHLPQDALAEFRDVSHMQAEGLMNSIDKWISEREDLGDAAEIRPNVLVLASSTSKAARLRKS